MVLEKRKLHFQFTDFTLGQFIIKVGSRDKIKKDYLKKQITFSCPANWYDYAIKQNNSTIGDKRECVYAHIPLTDPRINEVDCFENPMGNNLALLIDSKNSLAYLRHEPLLLSPAYCFFQREICIEDFRENKTLQFNLEDYCSMMQYNIENAYFWVVYDAKGFENDLRKKYSKFNKRKPRYTSI